METNVPIATTDASFTPIPLPPENENSENLKARPGKVPKRVLHFSDGVLEEFSSEDEDEQDKSEPSKAVDTKKLSWPQYFLYASMAFGNGTLKVCDYVGEGLASFFGITTPKYQYEIDEYKKMVQEEQEAKKKEDVEMQGWREKESNMPSVVSCGPSADTASETETGRY